MLTQKQEAFCTEYIETGNASEAYRRAYSASKMSPGSVNVRASQMLSNRKIAVRLQELRKPVVEAAQMTLEGHLQRLEELSIAAEKAEQYGPAIKAEESRGKAAGFYKERIEVGATESLVSAIIAARRRSSAEN
ncbi:MAG TPA: terminase small subunit [Castellaniella sp.]|uniref:terminase small subunit n=1 Tax=Castellaniella sp. TaxID=1955812 RepID=UPI002EFB1FFF